MPTIAITMIGHNEARNLPTALASVKWADELIYVDCESSDNSIEIARRYTDRIFTKPNLANLNVNKAFGIEQATCDWIFYLDPDEAIDDALAEEIRRTIDGEPRENAFSLPRRNYFFGTWIKRGGHYPDRQLRLFRRGKAQFPQAHVHEKLKVDGGIGKLQAAMDHYTSDSPLTSLRKLDFFSSFNARDMVNKGMKPTPGLAFQYFFWKPLSRFVRRYGFKGGFLDGWPGLIVAMIQSIDFPFRFIKFWYWSNNPEDTGAPKSDGGQSRAAGD